MRPVPMIIAGVILAAAASGAAQVENETRKEPPNIVALEQMFMD